MMNVKLRMSNEGKDEGRRVKPNPQAMRGNFKINPIRAYKTSN
ncbi:MAG: hypothetical protein ACXIUD_00870 [Mongoliitalea sp.]